MVSFSSVYAFIHDRLKMVHRDSIWQGSDCYCPFSCAPSFDRPDRHPHSHSRVHAPLHDSGHTLLLLRHGLLLLAQQIAGQLVCQTRRVLRHCNKQGYLCTHRLSRRTVRLSDELRGVHGVLHHLLQQPPRVRQERPCMRHARNPHEKMTFSSTVSKAQLMVRTIRGHWNEAVRAKNEK